MPAHKTSSCLPWHSPGGRAGQRASGGCLKVARSAHFCPCRISKCPTPAAAIIAAAILTSCPSPGPPAPWRHGLRATVGHGSPRPPQQPHPVAGCAGAPHPYQLPITCASRRCTVAACAVEPLTHTRTKSTRTRVRVRGIRIGRHGLRKAVPSRLEELLHQLLISHEFANVVGPHH